ncbi:hypothetical protein QTG64_002249 [Vibrio vulnificus]|nr:hypothetical protein [Vibrio vulnificus]
MSDKKSKHDNVALSVPIQASKTAFLIEGLDRLDIKDKPYHVKKWDFSTAHVVGVRYRLTLSFVETKPEYVNGIQDALYTFYHHSKKQSSLPLSVSRMESIKSALQVIADCFERTDWSRLDNGREWKSFIRKLRHRKLSSARIGHILTALNKLTEVGFLSSYVDAQALKKCAIRKESKQHVAIPHKLYQCIMSQALETVEKYHSFRHEISLAMGEAYAIKRRIHNGEWLTVSQ